MVAASPCLANLCSCLDLICQEQRACLEPDMQVGASRAPINNIEISTDADARNTEHAAESQSNSLLPRASDPALFGCLIPHDGSRMPTKYHFQTV